MFLLAIAVLGLAFYEVEKDRKAEKVAADKDVAVNASTQGCGCSGGSRASDGGGVSEEDVMYSVAGRVDPRLRVRR